MRKKEIEKRKKYTTNTYMREALDYEIEIFRKKDCFVTIKKYKELTSPVHFLVEKEPFTYIDEGYTLVELTPLKENYNMRFYYDKDMNYIDCYVDITLKNGVEYQIPYYIDLYLDILHNPKTDTYFFVDEEDLKNAYEEKKISKKDYQFAYKIGKRLLKEIEEQKNEYFNWDIKKLIEEKRQS